ncbi:MAG: transporter [Candidatus Tectimicrobiota bacterium]
MKHRMILGCLVVMMFWMVHDSAAHHVIAHDAADTGGEGLGLNSLLQIGRSNALSTLLGSLFGGNGITLAPASGHAPHFTVSSTAAVNQLNRQIAREIGVFPFTSSQGGFTYAFDTAQGTFVRTTQTLGPIFAEKASTLGRGKLNFNTTYTFYTFNRFNGESLNNLRVMAEHQPDVLGNVEQREGFENDVILIALDLSLRVRLVSLAATYGVTDRLDIGVLLPIVNVNMNVKANARIITSPDNPTPDVHTFSGAPTSPIDERQSSATGIGDVIIRAKYHFLDSQIADISGALLARLGTGDEENFLGTGTTSLRPVLIVSRTIAGLFTPHLNIGYDFHVDQGSRNSLEYAAGFEVGSDQFTVGFDLLGTYRPKDDNGTHIVNGSLGAKWNPLKQFVLFLNAQIPFNDSGLRSNLVTTFGAEYSF